MTRITSSLQLRNAIRRIFKSKLLIAGVLIASSLYFYPSFRHKVSEVSSSAAFVDYPVTFNEKWGRRVVFVKTHKTGSTTLQAVLARIAKHENLSVALPLAKRNFFCYFHSTFKASQADRSSPQMVLHHLNPNYEELNKLIPKTDFGSFYVTILRNVPDTFQSRLAYYRNKDISRALPQKREPLALAEETVRNYEHVLAKIGGKHGVFNEQLRIVMGNWYYYQFQQKAQKSPQTFTDEEILETIAGMEANLDLVLITEYFEESLILLADLLNLPLDDIRFVRMYERFRTNPSTDHLSATSLQKLHEILKADFRIYDHFRKLLESKISAYGIERMEKQKISLQKANDKVRETCIAGEIEIKQSSWRYFVPKLMTIKVFELKPNAPEFCKFFTWSEFEWLNYFRHQRIVPK